MLFRSATFAVFAAAALAAAALTAAALAVVALDAAAAPMPALAAAALPQRTSCVGLPGESPRATFSLTRSDIVSATKGVPPPPRTPRPAQADWRIRPLAADPPSPFLRGGHPGLAGVTGAPAGYGRRAARPTSCLDDNHHGRLGPPRPSRPLPTWQRPRRRSPPPRRPLRRRTPPSLLLRPPRGAARGTALNCPSVRKCGPGGPEPDPPRRLPRTRWSRSTR